MLLLLQTNWRPDIKDGTTDLEVGWKRDAKTGRVGRMDGRFGLTLVRSVYYIDRSPPNVDGVLFASESKQDG